MKEKVIDYDKLNKISGIFVFIGILFYILGLIGVLNVYVKSFGVCLIGLAVTFWYFFSRKPYLKYKAYMTKDEKNIYRKEFILSAIYICIIGLFALISFVFSYINKDISDMAGYLSLGFVSAFVVADLIIEHY